MSNAKDDHSQILRSILNGESLKKAKAIVPPVATPSGSPNTKGTGFTSLGKAKANYTPPPDTNIIPIFPMRYAIKGDALSSLMESPRQIAPPQNINNLKDHELLRVRKGYIFIYDDKGVWNIFSHYTDSEDTNGTEFRQLDDGDFSAPYSFSKVFWSNGARSDWTKDEKENGYPFAFVTKDVKTFWIAYSEERWPKPLFVAVSTNSTLKNQLMTQVNVSDGGDTHAVPLSELSNISDAFTKEVPAQSNTAYEFENLIRHTMAHQEPSAMFDSFSSYLNGLIVAIHDPIGEHLDINAMVSFQNNIATKFYDDHYYPLTIGQLIEQLQASDRKYKYQLPDTPRNRRNKIAGNRRRPPISDPLSLEFDTKYGELKAEYEENDKINATLTQSLALHGERTGKGTAEPILSYLSKHLEHAKGADLEEHITYYCLYYAKTLDNLSHTIPGTNYVQAIINAMDSEDSPPLSFKQVKAAGAFLSNGLKGFIRASVASGSVSTRFPIVLDAVCKAIGKEAAYKYVETKKKGSKGTYQRKVISQFVETFFEASSEEFKSDSATRQIFESRLRNGGRFIDNIKPMKQNGTFALTGKYRTESPASSESGKVYIYRVNMKFALTPQSIDNHEKKIGWDYKATHLGIALSFLSLYDTLASYNTPNRAHSAAGQLINDPRAKITKAFADSFSAVFALNEVKFAASAGMIRSDLTVETLAKAFKKRSLIDKYIRGLPKRVDEDWLELLKPSRANVSTGRKLARHTVKGLGVIGVFLSAGLAYESYAKGDTVGAIGNSITAIGSFILLFSTIAPPLFIVAIGLVIIGTIISLFSDDEKETWIEHSFWGTSVEYLGIEREETSLKDYITMMQKPSNKTFIANEFEKETKYFLDVMSSFRLEDKDKDDNVFEVYSAKITDEESLESLKITYECYRYIQTSRGLRKNSIPRFIRSLNKQLIAPGEVKILYNTVSMPEKVTINFKATLPRYPNGEFSENLEIEITND
ncbi:hypothetical protein Q4583_08340 [Neptunomonas phycophila]|uniref:toxin VasX n=1 Tax=Neptunomonas phycophila TaxID=1572645 RepID=UPI0026E49617|nr:toxin VasX [Neptunomonas phycophila]MDO6784119.1 hypothetical protein [Neptunomonas phycophila]